MASGGEEEPVSFLWRDSGVCLYVLGWELHCRIGSVCCTEQCACLVTSKVRVQPGSYQTVYVTKYSRRVDFEVEDGEDVCLVY